MHKRQIARAAVNAHTILFFNYALFIFNLFFVKLVRRKHFANQLHRLVKKRVGARERNHHKVFACIRVKTRHNRLFGLVKLLCIFGFGALEKHMLHKVRHAVSRVRRVPRDKACLYGRIVVTRVVNIYKVRPVFKFDYLWFHNSPLLSIYR